MDISLESKNKISANQHSVQQFVSITTMSRGPTLFTIFIISCERNIHYPLIQIVFEVILLPLFFCHLLRYRGQISPNWLRGLRLLYNPKPVDLYVSDKFKMIFKKSDFNIFLGRALKPPSLAGEQALQTPFQLVMADDTKM